MKIGLILDQEVKAGGGFQQAINAILQIYALCGSLIDIEIFTSIQSNMLHPALKDKCIFHIKPGFFQRVVDSFLVPTKKTTLTEKLLAKLKLKTTLERTLLKHSVDIVYFLSPNNICLKLKELPFIFTVWDLCHRDHPEFPEVYAYSELESRENLLSTAITKSFLTLTDSEVLAEKVCASYGADNSKIIAMPFSPAHFVKENKTNKNLNNDFFFYPAQFWPHKNHARIIEALAILKTENIFPNVVFCGADKGNRAHIEALSKKSNIENQVKFLGFLPDSDVQQLYSDCIALIMPTYFGPTNLPPLEAWASDKPVIYSAHLRDQVGEAAICINPDCEIELANAIKTIIFDKAKVASLILEGRKKLQELAATRNEAEKKLANKLFQFRKRITCWKIDD